MVIIPARANDVQHNFLELGGGEAQVEVSPPQGRCLLTWHEKHPLRQISALPPCHLETFTPSRQKDSKAQAADANLTFPSSHSGLLICGENKDALGWLLAQGLRGRVNLAYLDPPFASGVDYTRTVTLRGPRRTPRRPSRHALGEQLLYRDTWTPDGYLQFMYERLLLVRDLLAEDGSLYLHCDGRQSHHLRCLVEEVFGPEQFRNEIAWCYSDAANSKTQWNAKHDTLLFATKSARWTFQYGQVLRAHSPAHVKKFKYEDEKGRYRLFGRNVAASPIRWHRDVSPEWEQSHPELVYRHYLKAGGLPLDWWQIPPVNQVAQERTAYRTQKPEELLARILKASSRPGDLVLDCFIGSGTTAAVAQKLGRRWIGCDVSPEAIQITSRRLQANILQQGDPEAGFSVWTMNSDQRHLPPEGPPQANLRLRRGEGQIELVIEDFQSPEIQARLAQQGMAATVIDDWRTMVESVLIDPDYDGRVFHASFADLPARKHELVKGRYTLPDGGPVIAVKIIDRLGGEVIVTQALFVRSPD